MTINPDGRRYSEGDYALPCFASSPVSRSRPKAAAAIARGRGMTDAQIIKFSTAFREGILGGRSSHLMCAAISLPLAPLLRLHGVRCEVVEGENGAGSHTWIKLADGRVLDPSADQYNYPCFKQYPPVYLGSPTELHDPELGYSPDAIRIEAGTGGTVKHGPTRSARAGAEGIAQRHD